MKSSESFFREYHYIEKARNKHIECSCGWSGKRNECVEKWIDTVRCLSGFRGMEFYCPKCGEKIDKLIMCRS